MARKSSGEEVKSYKEFEVKGVLFRYTGRLYPDKTTKTAKCDIVPMTLCLNGVITIKGCKLFRTDKNSWIQGPQYAAGKGKDAEYKDYLYIDKELNTEMDALVSELEKILDA